MTTASYVGGLPPAECPLGYPDSQVRAILGGRLDDFNHWMRGQTVALCDGRRYDYTTKQYVADDCAGHPHGMVVYGSDLARFLGGRRPLD